MRRVAFALLVAWQGAHATSYLVYRNGQIQQSASEAKALAKSLAFCTANPDVLLAFTDRVTTVPATSVLENAGSVAVSAQLSVDAVCLPGSSEIRLRFGPAFGNTAQAGSDFVDFNFQLSTPPIAQYSAPVIVPSQLAITLLNDNLAEPDESLDIQVLTGLVVVRNGAGAVTQVLNLEAADSVSASLVIQDDDNFSNERFNTTLGAAAAGDPVAAAAIAPLAATCQAEAALPPAQQNVQLIAQCQAILANPQNAVTALRAISGEEFSAQITSSQDNAQFITQGVSARLNALRNAYQQSTDDIAMSIDGVPVPTALIGQALTQWFGLAASETVGESALLDQRFGVFANLVARKGDRRQRAFEVGFDFDGYQALVGMDYRFTPAWVSGVALGIAKLDNDLDAAAGSLESDARSLTIYGSYAPNDRWYLDFALAAQRNEFTQQRQVDLRSLGSGFGLASALGETDSRQNSLSLGVGYLYARGATSLTPSARLSYAKTTIDGFAETGTGINDLIYPQQDFRSLQFALGLNASHTLSRQWGVLQPFGNVDFSFEQKNEAFGLSPRLRIRPNQVSTPIFIREADRRFGRVELGLLFLLNGGWQISTSYSELFGYSDLRARSFSLNVRTEF